ncbi:acetolactate synthase-1/2/3 large subunit [Breznakia sp. PF5-3]|uniref:biosynthetic-type acetolactate synthase large subunit n=1 Tax=unclassified Breznakia TaxID=2623764 RepID=UPI0024058961|nr:MULTISPECIES: biosynthetic-type acetolactate synthase large subunit [unclassified Breznakia]MDF9825831.1 acetolactate synthase-1/2/3 large subunit [Breznakia sp. PM6-1]MDF9836636.1 acetolactate synthase-1/2/3 large subunit [Breznakia sp. PF5-3]MDF9838883.1 acetolactate synthase-1/2/3 large subunit [Breznakia sp. PFB2-8]MDF9860909.1 acetolactate synthase-1/2/3 large subunit [Breznakia sp. PH5-24]
MKLRGSQIIMEILLEHGVDTVFGYPGGAALFIYDSLYDYSDRIHHILTAHEQGAAHAADGYARASGKTGVVFATSGPGATNLVTGIATAFMDSIPMVAITANVADSLIGRDAFQEISITGVTLPITKHNYFVNRIEDLADALRNAFRIANEGRKGPVLIDVTKDVSNALCEFTPAKPMELHPHPEIEIGDIKEIAEIINMAKKPIIYFGGGVAASDAREELAELIQKADIPSTYTMMAAGVIDYDDPKSLGLIGMHGSMAANRAVDEADLVIALGTRFSDRVALNTNRFAQRAAIIQIDIDASEINKNVEINYSIIGDIKEALTKLLPFVEAKTHDEWVNKVCNWRKEINVELEGAKLRPKDIIVSACDLTDKETIYVTDVGQHQLWAAQYVKHKNTKSFLTSGGLGTMGFGYGASIGAQIACPQKRIIHFTGDGSFHMNLNEACTAVSQNLPIITIIMNNQVLGMVYQWQTTFYKRHFSQTTPERKTDFVKLAEGFGAKGYHAETLEEFEEAFKKALTENGPVWIDCYIDREEKVLPMIPNGGTIEDMITE